MTGRLNFIAALILALTISCPAFTQTFAAIDPLPDAPPTSSVAGPRGAASVTGLLRDDQGVPISDATVTLVPLGKLGQSTARSSADGAFTFTGVLPGQYRITVSAQREDFYSSGAFTVQPEAAVTLPTVSLRVSTTTSINIVASPDQIAVAQIHQQEQQRVFGVFQNFYTSYIWDAKPMPVNQKYKLAIRSTYDLPQFLIVAGVAGAEQFNGTYPGYGPGIGGYGKRYGAALADALTSRIIGSAILPSVLHQDPRYFYQGSGSVVSRGFHAASFTFVARGDNGKNQPNFSHMLGSLASAGLANSYHPASSRGLGDTFQTFGVNLAANIIGNMFREFVLRDLEKVPDFANGKH